MTRFESRNLLRDLRVSVVQPIAIPSRPSITICKSKSAIKVEYALRDMTKPIGVSEYQITENLPEQFRSSLPTIEQIEAELGEVNDE